MVSTQHSEDCSPFMGPLRSFAMSIANCVAHKAKPVSKQINSTTNNFIKINKKQHVQVRVRRLLVHVWYIFFQNSFEQCFQTQVCRPRKPGFSVLTGGRGFVRQSKGSWEVSCQVLIDFSQSLRENIPHILWGAERFLPGSQ